ncbi:hypothetical protein GR160_02645 [Flavobacterium sp. Sd200]|uniref:hypothetical protein n=1 Tax=Flavobacterium sp. Sd200 TaxID=2692211 RepID=UPI001368FD4D|nr:hypothetical protein [Flavobacterium sp. Sd200]MXN90113.1 hypothetical protein [Flavobacterium sp. Sd200]
MKNSIIFLIIAVLNFNAFAQRTNNNDDLRVEYISNNAPKVYFTINSKWFTEDDTLPVRYIADNDVMILNASVNNMGYEETLNRLKQDKRLKLDVLEDKKRLKCRHTEDVDFAVLSYGIFLADGIMLTLSIKLPNSKLPEWEPHFDNVCQTLSLYP